DESARTRDPAAACGGGPARDSADPPQRRLAEVDERVGDYRDGRRRDHDAGDFRVRKDGRDAGWQGHRPVPRDGRPAEVLRASTRLGDPPAGRHVRRRHRGALMLLLILVFFLGAGLVVGAYAFITFYLPGAMERRELDRRLRDVTAPSDASTGGHSTII